jgi:uncharacterized protein (DUF1810 family)
MDSLERFVDAQKPAIDRVLAELRAGYKRSHWMWFIFPQIRGLGRSPTAERYAIGTLAEATAYLQHPLLGSRLRECTRLILDTEGRTIGQILGTPDDLKFRSSMTLFSMAAPEERLFAQALEKYYSGIPDPLTLECLGTSPGN